MFFCYEKHMFSHQNRHINYFDKNWPKIVCLFHIKNCFFPLKIRPKKLLSSCLTFLPNLSDLQQILPVPTQ